MNLRRVLTETVNPFTITRITVALLLSAPLFVAPSAHAATYEAIPNVAALVALGSSSPTVGHAIVAAYSSGYIGGGAFDWVVGDTDADDGCNIFSASGVATGRWVRRQSGENVQPLSNCDTLAHADAAAAAASIPGVFDVNVTLVGDTVLTAKWQFAGGVINPATYNLTFDYAPDLPPTMQAFSTGGSGTIEMAAGIRISPYAFGAKSVSTDSTFDSLAPVNAALKLKTLDGSHYPQLWNALFRVTGTVSLPINSANWDIECVGNSLVGQSGLYADWSSGGNIFEATNAGATHIKIRHCRFASSAARTAGSAGNGIYIKPSDNAGVHDLVLEDISTAGNPGQGIELFNLDKALVSDFQILNNTGIGLYIETAGGLFPFVSSFDHGKISGNGQYCLYAADSSTLLDFSDIECLANNVTSGTREIGMGVSTYQLTFHAMDIENQSGTNSTEAIYLRGHQNVIDGLFSGALSGTAVVDVSSCDQCKIKNIRVGSGTPTNTVSLDGTTKGTVADLNTGQNVSFVNTVIANKFFIDGVSIPLVSNVSFASPYTPSTSRMFSGSYGASGNMLASASVANAFNVNLPSTLPSVGLFDFYLQFTSSNAAAAPTFLTGYDMISTPVPAAGASGRVIVFHFECNATICWEKNVPQWH